MIGTIESIEILASPRMRLKIRLRDDLECPLEVEGELDCPGGWLKMHPGMTVACLEQGKWGLAVFDHLTGGSVGTLNVVATPPQPKPSSPRGQRKKGSMSRRNKTSRPTG